MVYSKHLSVFEKPTFILRFVSYGHSNGPLDVVSNNEKGRLSYSVRDVPSPPAQQKKRYTGLSPKMRNEILSNKGVQARLEQILEAIEEKMTELEDERSREPSPEPEAIQAILKDPEPPREVIVAIMCEEGRHRSVSFVEELSKNPNLQRRNWEVKVEHRDLSAEDMEQDDEEESDEEVTSPGHVDPKAKKQIDKRRKKIRSMSMRIDDD